MTLKSFVYVGFFESFSLILANFLKNKHILLKLLKKYMPEMEIKSDDLFFFFGRWAAPKNP